MFIGGGTPSIIAKEWESILDLIKKGAAANCEITIECNPEHIHRENLEIWSRFGINRISLGIQSFAESGLKFLTRNHSPEAAKSSLDLAQKYIPNCNADLIYGWPGQTLSDWERDLQMAVATGIPHLSLYCLTFEAQTPIGRKVARGKITPEPDNHLADCYELAVTKLANAGFEHEEVSNWSKPGYSCGHNWLYWQGSSYVGIGPGAHGFLLGEDSGPGVRYSYDRNDRLFLRNNSLEFDRDYQGYQIGQDIFARRLEDFGISVDFRNLDDWLLEMVATSIRTQRGVPIQRILSRTQKKWIPTDSIASGIRSGVFSWSSDRANLELSKVEWFREQQWTLAVAESFA